MAILHVAVTGRDRRHLSELRNVPGSCCRGPGDSARHRCGCLYSGRPGRLAPEERVWRRTPRGGRSAGSRAPGRRPCRGGDPPQTRTLRRRFLALTQEGGMSASNYSLLCALIFTLVAALQLVRAIGGWSVTIGKTSIPLWASWLACVVATILAWLGFAASQA